MPCARKKGKSRAATPSPTFDLSFVSPLCLRDFVVNNCSTNTHHQVTKTQRSAKETEITTLTQRRAARRWGRITRLSHAFGRREPPASGAFDSHARAVILLQRATEVRRAPRPLIYNNRSQTHLLRRSCTASERRAPLNVGHTASSSLSTRARAVETQRFSFTRQPRAASSKAAAINLG